MAWRCLAAVAAFLLLSLPPAFAQRGGVQVTQGGAAVVPGHLPSWTSNGILGDAGGAAGVASGSGIQPITGLGITALGMPFCINDNYTNAAGGYHQFCLGANATVGGATSAFLSENAYGGAAALPLNFNINGANYQFPYTVGGIVGPSLTTAGHCAIWNNGAGSLLADEPCMNVNCPAIEQYGGSGNNTADNLPAMTALIAAAPPGEICASFGTGTYYFSGAVSTVLPAGSGFSIVGQGIDVSKLRFPASDGFDLTESPTGPVAPSFSGVTIVTGSIGLYKGISIVWNGATISPWNPAQFMNVKLSGDDWKGAGLHYWATGLSAVAANNINAVNLHVYGPSTGAYAGTGVNVTGGGGPISVVYNFINPDTTNLQYGLEYSAYAQGFNVIGGNFGDTLGVFVPAGLTGQSQLTVTGAQFGIETNDIGIDLLSLPAGGVLLSNNFFVFNVTTGPMYGIWLQSASGSGGFTITGNGFGWGNSPTNTVGISGASGAANGIISGNYFLNIPIPIDLAAGTSDIVVGLDNLYAGGGGIVNAGTNTVGSISPYGGGIQYTSGGMNLVAPAAGNVGLFAGGTALGQFSTTGLNVVGSYSVNGTQGGSHAVSISGCTMNFTGGLFVGSSGC